MNPVPECGTNSSGAFRAGERVLLQGRPRSFLIELITGRTLHTHDGVVKHDDVIGQSDGAVVPTHLGRSFTAVRPTLVQRMMKVKRKTQIIYPKEAARIALELSVGPGSRVIEIGGGSGAMTTLLATLVRPNGRVYSFDRNPEFQDVAKENISKSGLSDSVQFSILEAGQPFGLDNIDAVVLDLPEPWLAVRPAFAALRPGGSFASITPNTEQLKQMYLAAAAAGFEDLNALEILERKILVREREGVRPSDRMIGFTGYLLFGRKLRIEPPDDSPRDYDPR